MAGLISGLAEMGVLGAASRHRRHDLTKDMLHTQAAYSNKAAAITCSRGGANPPWSTELGPLSIGWVRVVQPDVLRPTHI